MRVRFFRLDTLEVTLPDDVENELNDIDSIVIGGKTLQFYKDDDLRLSTDLNNRFGFMIDERSE